MTRLSEMGTGRLFRFVQEGSIWERVREQDTPAIRGTDCAYKLYKVFDWEPEPARQINLIHRCPDMEVIPVPAGLLGGGV